MEELAGLLIITAAVLVIWYTWLTLGRGRVEDYSQEWGREVSQLPESMSMEPTARWEAESPRRLSGRQHSRAEIRREETRQTTTPQREEISGGEGRKEVEEERGQDEYEVPESMLSSLRETYELLSQLRSEAERLSRASRRGAEDSHPL